MGTALLVALMLGITPAGAPAAVADPRPAHAPVIEYLPHPVQVPVTDNSTNALYLLCLANARSYCAGFDTITTIGLVLASIDTVCIFVNCPEVWRKIRKGSGKHTKVTLQVEMAYSGTTDPHRHDCIGANPTPSDGNNGVYLSRPSQCFGHNQTSWLVVPEPHGSFELWNEQGLSYGQDFRLFNIKPKVGYHFYVVPASQPGYTKYVLDKLGTCLRYC